MDALTRIDYTIARRRPRQWEHDRYEEARLGARLHIWAVNAMAEGEDPTMGRMPVDYARWAECHHAGQEKRLAYTCPVLTCPAGHYPHDPDDYGHSNACGCDWGWKCALHRAYPDGESEAPMSQ